MLALQERHLLDQSEAVVEVERKAEGLDLMAPIVGHAGDGNFHVSLLIDMEDAQEVARAAGYVSWLNDVAIEMEGTCTGEHGIGQGKKPYLRKELGAAVDVMVSIKRALDPKGIMNPGKILG